MFWYEKVWIMLLYMTLLRAPFHNITKICKLLGAFRFYSIAFYHSQMQLHIVKYFAHPLSGIILFKNSEDPYQLASDEADQDSHCFSSTS